MSWVKVIDDLASFNFPHFSSKQVTFQNETICLSRLSGNNFKAISDTCSHDGASLSAGKLSQQNSVECPWHHYHFDLSSGECINHDCPSMKTFPVKIENNQLFINL